VLSKSTSRDLQDEQHPGVSNTMLNQAKIIHFKKSTGN
jgi:hypothetical protein